jgi:hypothetical protein
MIKRTITTQTNQEEKWNLFIDLIVMEDEKNLSEVQLDTKLCFFYEAEVLNGGHLQYFNNRGISQTYDCFCALKRIGAIVQANILADAMKTLKENGIEDINSVEDYVAEALENKFGDVDNAFYDCSPDITSLLEDFILKYEYEFFEIQR